jgi:hypothetical protein
MNEELSLFFIVSSVMIAISIVFFLVALHGFIRYGQREEDYPEVDNGLTSYFDEINRFRKPTGKSTLFEEKKYLDQETIQKMETLVRIKMEGLITEEAFWYEMKRLIFKKYFA